MRETAWMLGENKHGEMGRSLTTFGSYSKVSLGPTNQTDRA